MPDVNIQNLSVIENDGSMLLVQWVGLSSANNNGASIHIHKYIDKNVTIAGVFDLATVKIQGSNDPLTVPDVSASWFDLNDIQSSPISKTAAAMSQIAESPLRIRPVSSGGGGSQSVNVTLFARVRNTLRT